MLQEAPRRNEGALRTLIEFALPKLKKKPLIKLSGKELDVDGNVEQLGGVLVDTNSWLEDERLRNYILDLVRSGILSPTERFTLWIPPPNSGLYYVATSANNPHETADPNAADNHSSVSEFYLLARRFGNGKPRMGSTQYHFLEVVKERNRERERLCVVDGPVDAHEVIVKTLGKKAGLRKE